MQLIRISLVVVMLSGLPPAERNDLEWNGTRGDRTKQNWERAM